MQYEFRARIRNGRLGVPGLFDGRHYFLLSEVETGKTLFAGTRPALSNSIYSQRCHLKNW
jgi:hypothetical protein